MSLQLRLRDTWLPKLFSRFFAASFRWNVPSSCRTKRHFLLICHLNITWITDIWFITETVAVTDLYGEDEDSTPGHHVEEEDHGFILMGRVGVKYSLGHHMTLRHNREWLIYLTSLILPHLTKKRLFLALWFLLLLRNKMLFICIRLQDTVINSVPAVCWISHHIRNNTCLSNNGWNE